MARGRALNGSRDAGEKASEALVSRALELRDAGRSDWLDEACKERPDARDAVRTAVERVSAVPELLARGASADPWIGRVLGARFRLVERIGAGAMGVVYLAEDRELGRKVACKVVRHGLMPPAQALERFAREARSMAAVQHPAVAAIHDRGRTEDDQVFLVMELVDGAPLSDVLDAARARAAERSSDDNAWIEERFGIARRGESSWLRTVVRWAAELAQGLETVHGAGVLHRDVKPSNIRVRRDGRPALLDFGIALLDDAESITRTPTSLGTPAYMPPEALTREGRRTRASDVYGLTATLHHMVTLRAPYEGTPNEVMHALATREPVPASRLRPGLPRDLQAILDKGMHRRPSARYASAAALEADLRAFLEFRPVAARPVTAIERVARRWTRSRAAQGALASLVVVALAGGGLAAANAWRERALDARRARAAELLRHVPPSLGVVETSNRVERDPAVRAELARLLDDAVAESVEPLPARLLGAAFRSDHGDRSGAARDMAAIADFVATPFARELAKRYVSATPASAPGGVDLVGLPEATTSFDRYLLAYHALRSAAPEAERVAIAAPLLAEADVREIPHAEELLFASTSFPKSSIAERKRIAVERYADVVRLESRLGARTAATAHVAGRMLVLQGRFDEAVRACEEAIELAPRSHVIRINAGYAAFGARRLDEARAHFEVARSSRPTDAKIVEGLAWVDVADGRFDEAERVVRDAAPGLERVKVTWLDEWLGKIATYVALDAHARGDHDAQCSAVERADASFAAVGGASKVKDAARRIADALRLDDEQALFVALAGLLENEPDHWWYRELLAAHMPAVLGPEASSAMRRALEAAGARTEPRTGK